MTYQERPDYQKLAALHREVSDLAARRTPVRIRNLRDFSIVESLTRKYYRFNLPGAKLEEYWYSRLPHQIRAIAEHGKSYEALLIYHDRLDHFFDPGNGLSVGHFPTELIDRAGFAPLAAVSLELLLRIGADDLVLKYHDTTDATDDNHEFLLSVLDILLKRQDLAAAAATIERLRETDVEPKVLAGYEATVETLELSARLRESRGDIGDLRTLTDTEFQALIVARFKELGFSVYTRPKKRQHSIDIVLGTAAKNRVVVQSKGFAEAINLRAARDLIADMSEFKATFGIAMTIAGIAPEARELALLRHAELWDHRNILQFLIGDLEFSSLTAYLA